MAYSDSLTASTASMDEEVLPKEFTWTAKFNKLLVKAAQSVTEIGREVAAQVHAPGRQF